MALSSRMLNRIGFIILGLTNNFAYVVMLSAAYDLLKETGEEPGGNIFPIDLPGTGSTINLMVDTNFSVPQEQQQQANEPEQQFCNQHSTSTVLLADSLPSLCTKLLYPFILVNIPSAYKAIGVAALSAGAFLFTGLSTNKFIIFAGIACASFACGLGETTYLSNSPRYGTVAISGWSAGTGISGLLGSVAYALLRTVLPIKLIMITMLVIPVAMLVAYFYIIEPVEDDSGAPLLARGNKGSVSFSVRSGSLDDDQMKPIWSKTNTQPGPYGLHVVATQVDIVNQPLLHLPFHDINSSSTQQFNYKAKLLFLPTLIKYFAPLFLVYYAEFFINQGLHELIYYPEITSLDHAAQYRWFQVTYQFGVMISRASLDFIVIRHLWTMSLLQVANAFIFLAHASKLFYIPNFYIVIVIIIYEGLLGGFTYSNTFYRIGEELKPDRQEFGISTVVIADTLGIVLAGSTAIPVHDSLCKLYA